MLYMYINIMLELNFWDALGNLNFDVKQLNKRANGTKILNLRFKTHKDINKEIRYVLKSFRSLIYSIKSNW